MSKACLIIFPLLFPFLASAHYGDDFFGHHMNMGFGFVGGGILILLFWALIIVGVAYLIKHLVEGEKESKRKEERAIEILKERYVKGEISKEEFEQKKKDLK